MNDFEPTTDLPQNIEADEAPIASSAKSADKQIQRRRRRLLVLFLILVAGVLLALGFEPLRVLFAFITAYLIVSIGFTILGAFARPVPEPPPPGELRKVKLKFRCTNCGAELRMTLANDEVPEPPKHCTEPMELTTPLDI